MNWKVFITVLISGFFISFPQNIIGCGGGGDPYDYYTSFFHPQVIDSNVYKPFYYTSYSFLYDENEPADVSELLAKEWAAYCGTNVSAADAKKLLNKFNRRDIASLYTAIEKGQATAMPDSVKKNSMASYFTTSKNLEGLGYILYAMQVEPFVTGYADAWEAPKRDYVKMAKLIKNGQQLLAAAKTDFFKLKYGFQIVRLAHYSESYQQAIELYDTCIASNKTISVLQPLALALKAGALFKTGQNNQAAYLFSKVFAASVAKRISNYLGFKWSINAKTPKEDYLSLCVNNKEKANMLALFAMGSMGDELPVMKTIYQLDATNQLLELLAVREINKLEETHFTPMLQKQKGGSSFYYYWEQQDKVSTASAAAKQVKALAAFLHEVASGKKVKQPALFETAAAYSAYMINDVATAKKYLAAAEKMNLAGKVKDQWMLTNMLVTINEKASIDAAFETSLLPSLQWVQQKALAEKKEQAGLYEIGQWTKTYRDLMAEILAKRYHHQGEYYKEALCVGASDALVYPSIDYDYGKGIDLLRNTLDAKNVASLYAYITDASLSKFGQFLLKKNAITQSVVTEFAGTAYLREYDYANAIQWFKKVPDQKKLVITTNPFIDLLYDQEEALPEEANFKTDKIAFATTMLQLEKLAATDKANAAKHYYIIANGLYNITYYGHAWQLVQYNRSGSDGYSIPKDATNFQKEYYGCYSALRYFEKAMNATGDKNFKARCLFMMAKCSQKQIGKPQYADYDNNWNQLGAAEKMYLPKFKYNSYFPILIKEYGGTTFYKEAYNSCSYLRDFVAKK